MKHNMSLFRKVLIGYLISIPVFIALVAATIMCFINLKTYSVYYAESTPHSDNIDPVAIEIIENLGWIDLPSRGHYYTDFDGDNTVYTFNQISNKRVSEFSYFRTDKSTNYYTFFYVSKTDWIYILDSDLNVIKGKSPQGEEVTSFTVTEMNEIKQEVHQFLDPIIETQSKPYWLNLQWLYDLLNHSRFN